MIRLSVPSELRVALLYSVFSVILTWPLVLGIGSDVPGDLGDSLLNMWILGWGAEHAPRLLTGSLASCGMLKVSTETLPNSKLLPVPKIRQSIFVWNWYSMASFVRRLQ